MLMALIILVILIFIKAIFCACDTSFTFLNRSKITQMSKKGNKTAKKIYQMLQKPTKFFSTIRVGITTFELLASAYAAAIFVTPIAEVCMQFKIEETISYLIAVLVVTIVLSYISLVFGELLPKRIGKSYPEKTSFALIYPVWFLSILNYPFEIMIHASVQFFSRIFKITEEKKEKMTEREIKMVIAEGKDQGIIDAQEKRLLLNALNFDDLTIKEILIPRDKVDFLEIHASYREIMQNIKTFNYTRIPVYDASIDHIVGILNMKDIVIEYGKSKVKQIELAKIIRKPFFVSKTDKADDVFKSMQLNSQAIAIVLDDGGKVCGIVTMEDMLERIVGNIFDEFDLVETKTVSIKE